MAARTASASPHSPYPAPRVAVGRQDGNRHFGERPPENKKPESPCHFRGGNPCFILWPPPFCFEITVSAPPSYSHRHIKEFPFPSPHIVRPAGKILPRGRKGRRQRRQLHRRERQLFTPITRWQGGGADGGCIFPVAPTPDLFYFLLLHRDRGGCASSAFIGCLEPAHWNFLSP